MPAYMYRQKAGAQARRDNIMTQPLRFSLYLIFVVALRDAQQYVCALPVQSSRSRPVLDLTRHANAVMCMCGLCMLVIHTYK